MPNGTDCGPILDEITRLETELAFWEALLDSAAPQEKPRIVRKIRELGEQHSEAHARLAECLGESPQPTPLVVTFSGTATLTIADARFPGPFASAVTARATFNPPRTALTVDSLSTITATFQTDIGPNTTTVSLLPGGTGTFDPSSGLMLLSIRLRFDHSIIFAGDSDAPIDLRTDVGSGSPVNRTTGAVTLVGASRFEGGFLNGTGFSMVLTGTLSPVPFP
jgi:hypothetical protein